MKRAVVLMLVLIGFVVGAAASAPAASLQETREALQAAREAGDEAEERRLAERLATAFDDPFGRAHLGVMLVLGLGGAPDVTRGVALVRRSALEGNLHGQYWLARFYAEGPEVEQNWNRALCWSRIAGSRNYIPSMRLYLQFLHDAKESDPELEERFAEALRKAGNAVALFPMGVLNYARASDAHKTTGLTYLLLAAERIDRTFTPETIEMVRGQRDHALAQLREAGRDDIIEAARKAAADWRPETAEIQPHDPDQSAACESL